MFRITLSKKDITGDILNQVQTLNKEKYSLPNNYGWLSNVNTISEIGSSQETQTWCKTFNFDIEFINNCISNINWR